MKSVTRNVFFVLLVLTGITMFFGIGSLPLRSPYEAAFGEVAREMAEAGNFLSPRLFDKFALGLAPLSYILSALSIDVFGATEFAVRLPAALGAILLTMAVYITTTHTFNERSGFWAGMAFGTAMLTFFLVKTAVPFSGLLFFVSLALLCFIRRHYWAMYVFLALCVLTDGPWALVFPVLIILAYLILTGQIYVLGRMHLLRGIVLFLVLCAPWVGTKFYLQGMPFLTEFFQFRDFGLVSLAAPDSGNPLWFYVPVLLAGMFPWTGLMLKSLKDSICESRTSDLEILLFYQIWWFITFLLFTICSRQFATSIVLTFPPLAVMIGWNLDRMRKENGRNHAGRAEHPYVCRGRRGLGLGAAPASAADLRFLRDGRHHGLVRHRHRHRAAPVQGRRPGRVAPCGSGHFDHGRRLFLLPARRAGYLHGALRGGRVPHAFGGAGGYAVHAAGTPSGPGFLQRQSRPGPEPGGCPVHGFLPGR